MEKKTIQIKTRLHKKDDPLLTVNVKNIYEDRFFYLDESEARQLQSALNEIFGDRVKELEDVLRACEVQIRLVAIGLPFDAQRLADTGSAALKLINKIN
jgi:hypothetical protein